MAAKPVHPWHSHCYLQFQAAGTSMLAKMGGLTFTPGVYDQASSSFSNIALRTIVIIIIILLLQWRAGNVDERRMILLRSISTLAEGNKDAVGGSCEGRANSE
jgi:hypothetical protein